MADTVKYNHENGTQIRLIRQPDGTLRWSDPEPIAQPSGKLSRGEQPKLPQTAGAEDFTKNFMPAVERTVTAGATSIPTLGGLAAQGVAKGAQYLPEGMGSAIKSGAESFGKALQPLSYPSIQGKFESQPHPYLGFDPTYYPKTEYGKAGEAGIQGVGAAVGGPISIARMLAGPVARIGGRVMTGVGAGLGSEAASQGLSALGFDDPYSQSAARAVGARYGGKGLAEGPRRLITPKYNQPISQAHLDLSQRLAQEPTDITSAGQFSGQPARLQTEANLAPHARFGPWNNLARAQAEADTETLARTAGISPTTVQRQGATPAVLNQRGQELKTQRGQLMGSTGTPPGITPNTQAGFDPEFTARINDIQNEYYRQTGTRPNPIAPSPLEQRLAEMYTSPGMGPGSARGMAGGRFGPFINNLDAQIKKLGRGGNLNDPNLVALTGLRGALVDAMDRSTQGTPYAGQWTSNLGQTGAQSVLRKTADRAKQAGILDPNVASHFADDPNSDVAQLALAQSQVHTPLPAPKEPSGLIPTAVGAAISRWTGQPISEGLLAGSVSGPTIQKSLLRNPITAGIYFHPWNQARLKNQVWPAGPGSTSDPATIARLLAIQGTQAVPAAGATDVSDQ